MKTELLRASELDYDAFTALQREAFAEVIAKAGSSADYMTPAFYRWKFRPPAAEGRIAVVWDDDGMVAANAMFPTEVRVGSDRFLAWQSCDTATATRGRGKGHFTRCIELLRDSLRDDELFFGFPNANSMRGFVKLGWESRGVVTTWVRPLSLPLRAVPSDVRVVERFGASIDRFAETLVASGPRHFSRDSAWLNWRYADHPVARYERLVHGDADEARGFVVVRRAAAMGRDVAVVMDLWGADKAVERELLRGAASWAWREGLLTLVVLDTALSRWPASRSGFVGVPSRFLPKTQLFMGAVKSEGTPTARAFREGAWRVQTGDWDAF